MNKISVKKVLNLEKNRNNKKNKKDLIKLPKKKKRKQQHKRRKNSKKQQLLRIVKKRRKKNLKIQRLKLDFIENKRRNYIQSINIIYIYYKLSTN